MVFLFSALSGRLPGALHGCVFQTMVRMPPTIALGLARGVGLKVLRLLLTVPWSKKTNNVGHPGSTEELPPNINHCIYVNICIDIPGRYVGPVVSAIEKSDLEQVLSRERPRSR